jgi:hypothetical protein
LEKCREIIPLISPFLNFKTVIKLLQKKMEKFREILPMKSRGDGGGLGLLVEPFGRPLFFIPTGATPSAVPAAGIGDGEKGPKVPGAGSAGLGTGTNASAMEPSSPYFLGRPRFFLAESSMLFTRKAGEPLPPAAAESGTGAPPPTGWYVSVGGGAELTGAKKGVPSGP